MKLRRILLRRLLVLAVSAFLALALLSTAGIYYVMRASQSVAESLLVNYVDALSRDQTLSRDIVSIQRHLSEFASKFETALNVKAHTNVVIDGRGVASYGRPEKRDWAQYSTSRTTDLISGERLSVIVTFSFKSYWWLAFKIALLTGGVLVLLLSSFYLTAQGLLVKVLSPLENLSTWMYEKSGNLTSPVEAPPQFGGNDAIEVHRLSGALNVFLQEFSRLHDEQKRLSYLEGQIEIAKQVAHDIRSPLSALRIVQAKGVLGQQKEEIIKKATERIEAIADELLSKTKARPKYEIHSIERVVRGIEECIQLKKVEFPMLDFELQCNKLDMTSMLSLPLMHLARVLSNLFNNSKEAGANRIQIFVSMRGSNFLISVADDGSGMSEVVRAGLKRGFTTKEHGHGLGLSAVSEVVRLTGGELRVDSQEGRGTTVEITLPVLSPP